MSPTRMDPPTIHDDDLARGASRCVHDMLNGTCAICRGLPDVPPLDPWDITAGGAVPSGRAVVEFTLYGPQTTARTFLSESGGRCVLCDRRFGEGAEVAWSPDSGGVIGPCCEAFR